MGLNKRDKLEKSGRGGGGAPKAEQVINDKTATQAPEEKTRRTCLHKQLRKTKFCLYHLQGVCQFGDTCAFAHSCGELQGAPDLRKTRICKAFTNGVCKDPECSFAHTEEELRSTDMFFKKTLCMWHEKGRCRNGDQCRFAHGFAELRTREQNEKALAEKGGKSPGARGPRIPKAMPANDEVELLDDGNMYSATMTGHINNNNNIRVMPTVPGALKVAPPAPASQGPNLEPMFVVQPSLPVPPTNMMHPPPGVGPPQAANRCRWDNEVAVGLSLSSRNPVLEQLAQCSSQLEQLSRLSSAMSATSGAHGQADVFSGLGQPSFQLQQLKLAAAAAAAAGAGQGETGDSTELEKLSQNIANLSLQLSRFEMRQQLAGKHAAEPDMAYALGSPNLPPNLYPMNPLMAEMGYPSEYSWGALHA